MKCGFVSIWFSRGQAFVTRTFMDALKNNHEIYIFARTGTVFGEEKMASGGIWDVPNLTRYPEYKIKPDDLVEWIQENAIDVVIFNEEYDFGLVEQVKKRTDAKIITYLDFYRDDWKPYMSLYDQVWCSTKRAYELATDFDTEANFIGWGVDTELFKPPPPSNLKNSKFTFFHNAGWLGNNFRKMTPAVIHTFNEACKHNYDITLLVHAQAGLDKLPPEIIKMIEDNERIEYRVGTVQQPGYYNECKILIFISKLEGLGLPLLEGMACGMPVIATDAPPMNEFVVDQHNGYLIPVEQKLARYDNIAFPENIVDLNAFCHKMLNFENRIEMGNNSRELVLNNYTLKHLKDRIERTF